jgi:uncharacterized oxidoreductase
MKLIDRTILITGGTSGIGLELARQLLERGNTVIVTGRSQDKLDETRRVLNGVRTIRSDVSDPEAVSALYDELIERFPLLDVLVNNAGIMRNITLTGDHQLLDLTREIEIGVKGPMWMIQQFMAHLRTRPNALIVNVSSGLAFVPFPAAPIYSAAKAAVHAYTRSLRAQLDGSGMIVVELAPPGTETPLFRAEFEAEMKREKGMDPGIVARHAIAGIEAGKIEIRPGVSNILKIASRVAPNLMFKQMIKLSQLKRAPV